MYTPRDKHVYQTTSLLSGEHQPFFILNTLKKNPKKSLSLTLLFVNQFEQ